MSKLELIYRDLAAAAFAARVPVDDAPCGAVHRFILTRTRIPEGKDFFVVLGVAGELADLYAREEGYESATARALARAFGRRAARPAGGRDAPRRPTSARCRPHTPRRNGP
jgi:hypothetical protein